MLAFAQLHGVVQRDEAERRDVDGVRPRIELDVFARVRVRVRVDRDARVNRRCDHDAKVSEARGDARDSVVGDLRARFVARGALRFRHATKKIARARQPSEMLATNGEIERDAFAGKLVVRARELGLRIRPIAAVHRGSPVRKEFARVLIRLCVRERHVKRDEQHCECATHLDDSILSSYNLDVAGRDTRGDTTRGTKRSRATTRGVVVAFSAGTPRFHVLAIDSSLAIGRDDAIGAVLDDERLSRHHAEIRLEGDALVVRDLGSRNGTFVGGKTIDAARLEGGAVVRAGGTVMLAVDDVGPLAGRSVRKEGTIVVGARFGAALAEVERAGRGGESLLLRGETGTGKEIAARRFHESTSRPNGPFTAFNCATIPEGLAERLLFGARRGAYSGATTDSEGVVQAADGGTLFLDEVGELDLAVQAKLLRVLETRDVMALGAPRSRRVDVRFCFATHRDLKREVAQGRFRADLFYRLGDRDVVLPALRARREDIPWLLAAATTGVDDALGLHPKLVETCMLRGWPGNVRELLRAARRAAEAASDAGEELVRVEHLPEGAGELLTHSDVAPPTAADVRAALGAASGNVSEAARTLGVHRTQLRRAMRKLGLVTSKA